MNASKLDHARFLIVADKIFQTKLDIQFSYNFQNYKIKYTVPYFQFYYQVNKNTTINKLTINYSLELN